MSLNYNNFVRNNIPYPVAIGRENIYYMAEDGFIPISLFPRLTKKDIINAYAFLYGYDGYKQLSEYFNIINFNLIQNRII